MKRRVLLPALTLATVLAVVPWSVSARGLLHHRAYAAMSSLEELRILPEVKISGKRVTLMDLCDPATIPEDWKEVLASRDVGEAPAPGEKKYVYPDTLGKYLDSFIRSLDADPSDTKIHMPRSITVELRTVVVRPEEVEAIFKEFVRTNVPCDPKDLVIREISLQDLPVLPAGEVSHEVVVPQNERVLGNVTATVNFYVDGEKAGSLPISGKVDLFGNVVHSSRPLRRDDVIAEADVETRRINIAGLDHGFASDTAEVIGKRVVQNLGANQVIDTKNLDKPIVLKRGDPVYIVYEQDGIRLTAKGKARENAGTGDMIRVMNGSSRKTVVCRVLDDQTVLVIP